jgi:ATP-dependent Clp protease protease subunit
MRHICVNQINEHGLRKFREEFYALDQRSDQPIIPIIIDCYGGEVYSLFGMISIIKATDKTVATIVDSKAMSAAAVLLTAGTKGFRFASEYAHVMIHEVLTGNYHTKVSDVNIDTNHALSLNKVLFGMLDKNCGQKPGFFNKLVETNKNSNLYLNSKQSKKYGIVDHIDSPKLEVFMQYTISKTGPTAAPTTK